MIDHAYILVGLVTGLIIGLTGVGGGAIMTPVLLWGFGVHPIVAIATDLWFAVITKLVGAKLHAGFGQVDWQIVRRLWCGSLPTAIVVGVLMFAGQWVGRVSWLTEVIGVVIILTALGLLAAPWLQSVARQKRLNRPSVFKAWQPMATVMAGAVIGLFVSLTSIGAGALGSVLLVYLYPLRMTPHRLVATDLIHAIPLAFVAGLVYSFQGLVNVEMLFNLLLGSIPGIVVGSIVSSKIPPRPLQILLAITLLLAGFKTLSV